MSQYLYHVTLRDNLVSIRQDGLLPSMQQWSDGCDYRGVMMYFSEEDAYEAIKRIDHLAWSERGLVVLLVEVSGYEAKPNKDKDVLVLTAMPISQSRVSVLAIKQCRRRRDTVDAFDDPSDIEGDADIISRPVHHVQV